MIRIQVIFCKFHRNSLSLATQNKIEATVAQQFQKYFNIREPLEVFLADGASVDNVEIYIAYNQLPPVINVATVLKRFVDSVAVILKDIIPAELNFKGAVSFIDAAKLKKQQQTQKNSISEKNPIPDSHEAPSSEDEFEVLAKQYVAEKPRFAFSQLVLADDVAQRINEALAILQNKDKLFRQWGLSCIMSPSVLLNLYGDSGTGKTMTAEAIASKLQKNIIRASYADIESKYHGEGPKKLKAIFKAAEMQDAILFIDEADSMLSARLGNVTQGSEQAINSMRSQLLISLEQFDGIVIFATNLIKNYDKAFLTRLICIELKRPDKEMRLKIWRNHLYPTDGASAKLNIPLGSIDLNVLAQYDFCGRDIRNAVKQACIHTVVDNRDVVEQSDLLYACNAITNELDDLSKAKNQNNMKIPEPVIEAIKKQNT